MDWMLQANAFLITPSTSVGERKWPERPTLSVGQCVNPMSPHLSLNEPSSIGAV